MYTILTRKIIAFIILTVMLVLSVNGPSDAFFGDIFGALLDIIGLVVDIAIGVVKLAVGIVTFTIDLVLTVVWDMGNLTEIVPIYPDGGLIGVIVSDTINLWDPITKSTEHTLIYDADISDIAFFPDSSLLASASQNNKVQLWNINTLQPLAEFTGHTEAVQSVSFSPNNNILASASNDKTIRLWNTQTLQHIDTLLGHTGAVLDLVFSPDGSTLASASADHTVKVWDTSTMTLITTLQEHTDAVRAIVFNADGSKLATAGDDGKVCIWDPQTMQCIDTFDNLSTVFSIDWGMTPEGEVIATGTQDGVARLWDTAKGEVIATLGHKSPVKSVAFTDNDTMLVTGSNDNKMRMWKITEVKQVQPEITASTAAPLNESTLDGSQVTFTLTQGTFNKNILNIRNAITHSGVDGVELERLTHKRVSDTKVTFTLAYSGNLTSDSTLTFTIRDTAFIDYDGDDLTTQLPIKAVTETLTATTPAPLTEETLNGSVVTLTLFGREYHYYKFNISVSGISGVTFNRNDITLVNNNQITIPLDFNGDITTDSTLTFTLKERGISNYEGPSLTAEVPVTATVTTQEQRTETNVNIPDNKLRRKIERALRKASGDPITTTEMATLTTLNGQSSSIRNLTGLEAATNLTTLKLGDNNISDISPLSALTSLTQLQLWDNNLTDISALSGLTNLTKLYIWGNNITDVTPLQQLTSLITLFIGENNITDISALSGLTSLTSLYLNENSISNISALSGFINLIELRIDNNTITDIAAVANMSQLEFLQANNNNITDITAITNLSNLFEFYVSHNSVIDLSPTVSNTGFVQNSGVDVRANPLSYPSINTHVPALEARGVYIDYDDRTATTLVKISGDNQQASVNAPLSLPFVVEVQDADSVAYAGVPVTFAVTTGGGWLSATNTTADNNGRAQSILTLGSSEGTNTVSVTAEEVSGLQTFTATATAITTQNNPPAFPEGITTTRSIAENTAAGVNIGNPVSATDADNDTLTYMLGGTDADAFTIVSTTGQLQTDAALDYETKSVYTVIVSVSDPHGGTDSITVTINITDVDEQVTPTNNAPVFTEVTTTTRTIAENTASGENIGSPISATDVDNDTLTYTLSGTDADSFTIVSTTGQLKTSAALDYETKSVYTVTVTVSDGKGGSDTITVTINITDVVETDTPTNVCQVGDILAPGDSCTYPDTEAVFSVQDDGTSKWFIPNLHPFFSWINQVSVGESMSITLTYNDVSYNFFAEQTNGNSWEIKEVGDSKTTDTETPSVTPVMNATSTVTEATLHEGKITLILSAGTFTQSTFRIRNAITLSGISGVSVDTFGVERVTDTQVEVELDYDGNMTADSILNISIGADAFDKYDGDAVSVSLSITAVTESITATPDHQLTEDNIDGSEVTITLNGRKFVRSIFDIREAFSVTGITGVSIPWTDPAKISNTQLTLKLEFDDDMTSDGTLTFTVDDDAIAGYTGSALTAQLSVTASSTTAVTNNAPEFTDGNSTTRTIAENTASNVNIGSPVSATDADNDTLTYTLTSTDAASFDIVSTTGQLKTKSALDYETKSSYTVTVSVSDGNGGSDSITVTINVTDVDEVQATPTLTVYTTSPLTETSLNGADIVLSLSGATFVRSVFDIRDEVSVSGITGVSFDDFFDLKRESDTQLMITLTFSGNMTSNGMLTFSISADALSGYSGSALTTSLSVTAVTETITATPEQPLTEDNIHGSQVIITLSGRKFVRSIFDIRDAFSVTGITGVSIPWHDPDKDNDTQLTLKLYFDGDMTSDGTLTFTVDEDAIDGYSGTALTAQLTVTAIGANILLANFPNPFNPETWIPYQLAKDADVSITIYDMRGRVVRELKVGHRVAGLYQSRHRAAYWDGKNQFGELVASGVYFYTLTAGDFTATRKMQIRK